MKVEFHVICHNSWITRRGDPEVVQCTYDVNARIEGPFGDGPLSSRLETVDVDPTTAVPVTAYRRGNEHYRYYHWSYYDGIYHPSFLRSNVFGLVLKTLGLYEEPRALGRPVRWAFPSKRLKLKVRDGDERNAYYSREDECLRFPSFESPQYGRIYAALSRDIVCHEAGHAILDGIAPDLKYSLTPESYALHEAVADLTALWMSIEHGPFALEVIRWAKGRLDQPSPLNAIGEQFALTNSAGSLPSVRSLIDSPHRIRDADRFRGIDGIYPLSLVMSSAIYRLTLRSFKEELKTWPEGDTGVQALTDAADRWRRMVIRGLELLPPGEAGFAGLVRAMLTAEQLYYSKKTREQRWLKEEMVKRGVVARSDSLIGAKVISPRRIDADLKAIFGSTRATRHFVDAHRSILRVPAGASFEIRMLLRRLGPNGCSEGILKVAWESREAPPEMRWQHRLLRDGTTAVFDLDRRSVIAILSTIADQGKDEREQQRAERNQMHRLFAESAENPGAQESAIAALVSINGAVQPRNTGRLLVNPTVLSLRRLSPET